MVVEIVVDVAVDIVADVVIAEIVILQEEDHVVVIDTAAVEDLVMVDVTATIDLGVKDSAETDLTTVTEGQTDQMIVTQIESLATVSVVVDTVKKEEASLIRRCFTKNQGHITN